MKEEKKQRKNSPLAKTECICGGKASMPPAVGSRTLAAPKPGIQRKKKVSVSIAREGNEIQKSKGAVTALAHDG
jgi:hypothetical protein